MSDTTDRSDREFAAALFELDPDDTPGTPTPAAASSGSPTPPPPTATETDQEKDLVGQLFVFDDDDRLAYPRATTPRPDTTVAEIFKRNPEE